MALAAADLAGSRVESHDPAGGWRRRSVWQAPLVPAALAVTVGIIADRYASVPFGFGLAGVAVGLAGWAASLRSALSGLPLVFLASAVVSVGAASHHAYRELYPISDVGNYVSEEPRPARLVGELIEEPARIQHAPRDPLVSIARPDLTVAVLGVTHVRLDDDWLPVSGRVRLLVSSQLIGPHAGDRVEVVGRLSAPPNAANPGERDQAAALRDQRIRAQMTVQRTPQGVTLIQEGWRWSLNGWLGLLRSQGRRALEEYVGPEKFGLATALLLGEDSAMTSADWEKYIRTGVIHALAISGQHLVVLGGFVWLLLRLAGVRRRRGAVVVAVFLIGYALLAGARPPAIRAAATMAAGCLAILVGRPALSANALALAWLMVLAMRPTDLVNPGCQLSFLAVAVLSWGVRTWRARWRDPLQRLLEESQPNWRRLLRRVGRPVLAAYAVNATVWLVAAPLVASRYHLVSPTALVIGPPAVLLASAALLSGFVLLLLAPVCGPVAFVCGWLTRCLLTACEVVVARAEGIPGGHWYVADIASWWLWIFYGGLAGFLLVDPLRARWRWGLLVGSMWLCVGLAGGQPQRETGLLRCMFLAVGHGGCTVLETPDGRTLLYDAGAIGGPDVTRRVIAPYLWSRGIRRVDEVFLSHADMDHFNGLPGLLERFAVGRVTCTPTFADKATPGVPVTLDAARRHGAPVRTVHAGDRLLAGGVEIDVLHPPAQGPPGNENTRSMVLRVRHAGHVILLTGDLEGLGLERVLAHSPGPADILMAPHHGSRSGGKREQAGRAELAARTRPAVVIGCEGPPRWPARGPDPYTAVGATYLSTWPHGAVTVVSRPGLLRVESFRTRVKFDVATLKNR